MIITPIQLLCWSVGIWVSYNLYNLSIENTFPLSLQTWYNNKYQCAEDLYYSAGQWFKVKVTFLPAVYIDYYERWHMSFTKIS